MNKFKDVKEVISTGNKVGNLSFVTCFIETFPNRFANCSYNVIFPAQPLLS